MFGVWSATDVRNQTRYSGDSRFLLRLPTHTRDSKSLLVKDTRTGDKCLAFWNHLITYAKSQESGEKEIWRSADFVISVSLWVVSAADLADEKCIFGNTHTNPFWGITGQIFRDDCLGHLSKERERERELPTLIRRTLWWNFTEWSVCQKTKEGNTCAHYCTMCWLW